MNKINGFSRYKVSSDGQILSFFYPIKWGIARRKEPKKLCPWKNKDGYEMVDLIDDKGKKYHKSIHRLVAEAFIKNPKNLPVVCHIDSNIKNNLVTNLRWGTIKDNIQDEIKRGTFRGRNKQLNLT